jgi:ATP-binding cassette subfamily C protein LapB
MNQAVTIQDAAQSEDAWDLQEERDAFDDPLLDCLVLFMKMQDRPLSRDALTAGLPLVDNRLTPELFVRAAKRAALSARIVKRPLAQISDLVLPAVLLLEDRQAVLLLELDRDNNRVRIALPETGEGESELSLQGIETRYLGFAIFMQAQHRFDERTPTVLNVRARHWFWGTLMKSWRIYRDVLLASFLINLFALSSPVFIMNVYDRVVPNQAFETLWVLAVGVSVVLLFDVTMRTLRGYFIDVAGKKADIALSVMIYEKVLGLKMEARPSSVGAFANNLHSFESIRDFITSATITAIVDLPFVVLFLGVIAFVAGPLVFVPILAIPILFIHVTFVRAPLREAVEDSYRASAQKNATLIESLTAVETVKALGAESVIQRKLERIVGYIAKSGIRSRLLSSSVVHLAVFLQQLAMVGIVVFGVYLIGEGRISMGGLIAAVMLTGRAMAPMAQVANLATQYHQAKASLASLEGIMSLPVERPEGKSFISRPRLEGAIEFQNVTFSYPNQEQAALNNVSFSIAAGERVAFIGRIGSGKTTIEKLIMGMYEPDSGSVHIDGIDVRQIDPADIRRNVGYVPQDITLFYGSVRDNIVYGVPHADDASILEASALAGVDEFANRHPLGFDMPVGERGEGLSGGQRQSVVIARAMLLNPPLFIMDEPTNSMDNASEARFKAQLRNRIEGKTVLLVTHRASLLDLVDRIIVMERGCIAADGPTEQVLAALRQGKVRGMRS